ncbi:MULTISPECIES: sulfatase-like hydrolase/transferase [unclassified Sphingomonas]|uniref:sulfatase-like hydrolase/transferase n=1 Tax=unclassified Sphingomonas TaxID=196159 RepID=UPI0028678852|nr:MULTISPECIES: sulfatase-like hydrolase/transferase [unclassified Sphingomonas]MDR6114729.1 N-sulfoglucosamine sulfohydrolase [Sphingomonas sp. SORGH_AS_0789]MDR6151598.1 N-sulfoglucosamine sulfohydrolase [Sphingomonas sp. SORGH_AS_0742]
MEEGANLASVLPQHFPLYTDLLETSGYHVGFDGKGWAPGQLKPVGRTRNPAGRSFADFAAFLANRPDGTPFCFWHGAHEPHRPYQPGIGIRSGIDPASMVVPPYLEDTPATRSDMADYRYYAEAFDRQAGAILDALEKAGELDNTLVVMTGDNGWPFPRGKATLYDAGTHVPLAIRYPRRVPAGMIVRDPVSLVDLAATFLELGGVSIPIAMDSRSLLTLFGPRARPPRSYVLLGRERHMDGGSVPGQGYPSRALRTGTHLYIRNFRPDRYPAGIPGKLSVTANEIATDTYAAFADIDAGQAKRDLVLGDTDTARQVRALATGKRPARELYDVRNDPYQLRNLADDPSSAKLVARLDRFLMRDLARTGDPRIVEGADHDLFDHYPSYSDPGFGRPASLGQ